MMSQAPITAEQNLAFWENLTPAENARICAGLRKGFEDHYWKLQPPRPLPIPSPDGN
jgi:hypothetical protein